MRLRPPPALAPRAVLRAPRAAPACVAARRFRTAALVAVAMLAMQVPAASAHGGDPDYRSVIDRVAPSVPGVSFQVLSYDSYMQLLDRDGHEVTIYGYEGEPYARVRGDGTVQVNERSPATYLNDDRFGEVAVPPIADPQAPPRWRTVDSSGTFIWHDHRMHYMSRDLPPAVTDRGRRTKVFDYRIPLRVDGRRGSLAGTLYWVGSPSPSKLPFVLVGIAVVVAGGALVLVVRRRRAGEEGGGDDLGEGEAW